MVAATLLKLGQIAFAKRAARLNHGVIRRFNRSISICESCGLGAL